MRNLNNAAERSFVRNMDEAGNHACLSKETNFMTSNKSGNLALTPNPLLTLTIQAAIARTGLSRATLYRMLARGDLAAIKAGKRTLIRADSLDSFLSDCPDWQPISVRKAA